MVSSALNKRCHIHVSLGIEFSRIGGLLLLQIGYVALFSEYIDDGHKKVRVFHMFCFYPRSELLPLLKGRQHQVATLRLFKILILPIELMYLQVLLLQQLLVLVHLVSQLSIALEQIPHHIYTLHQHIRHRNVR